MLGHTSGESLAEQIGLRTRRLVDWIQRRIEAQAPSTRHRDGYFWVIWRIDEVANVSGIGYRWPSIWRSSPMAKVAEAVVIG